MSVTREELFEAVWSGPMIVVAKRYKVSGSFLARVCAHLKVPHPPRGYWAKLKVGRAPPRPTLPNPEPGDEVEWSRERWSAPRRAPLPLPTAPPETRLPRTRRAALPDRHPLVRDVRPLFEAVRKVAEYRGGSEYLRPLKRKLPDILVSPAALTQALDLASELYLSFERRDFRVVVSDGGRGTYWRKDFEHRLTPGAQPYSDKVWSPCDPTVAFIGTVAFGLTVYDADSGQRER